MRGAVVVAVSGVGSSVVWCGCGQWHRRAGKAVRSSLRGARMIRLSFYKAPAQQPLLSQLNNWEHTTAATPHHHARSQISRLDGAASHC